MNEQKSVLDAYVESSREIADFLRPQRAELADRVKAMADEVVQAVEDLLTAEY